MRDRDSKFNPRYLLIILATLCVLLIILSSVSSTVNNSVRAVFNVILTPMQTGLNKIGGAISDEGEYLVDMANLEDENDALKEENEALRMQVTKYELENAELEQYRELLDMKEQYPDYPTIGAHVIGDSSSNSEKTVLIDVGSNDGIQVDMNVIAQGGLVGIVSSVTPTSSTVRLIIDNDCQVGAMSVSLQDTCISRGDISLYNEGKILLEKADKDSGIVEGTKIVTSNKSSMYLPGLVIGYATEVETAPNALTKSGYIIPVVDFNHLDCVLVITKLKESVVG